MSGYDAFLSDQGNHMADAGQHVHYHIHLDHQTVIDVELDTTQPIYRVAGALAQQYGRGAEADQYTFFVGRDRRPLIRELSLAKTPYAEGGDLYLAPLYSPWWLPTADEAPSTAVAPAPGGMARIRTIIRGREVILGLLTGLVVLAAVWMLRPQASAARDEEATRALALPVATQPTPAATATLLPATPTPQPSPTLDPATQASIDYQGGLIAYDRQDWPQAAALLQRVYDYKADYLNITDVLAATYYNWGVKLRDTGDITQAATQFAAALAIDPAHPLAPAELAKAQLYVDAQRAVNANDVTGAIAKLRELIALQSDYADSIQQLYGLLVAQANALVESGGIANLRAAEALYREAASLAVADRTSAETGLASVIRLLPKPTPTPRPAARPAPPPESARLRFSVLNYNDNPACISINISGIGTNGWSFTVDGIRDVGGRFDGAGNARACGLGDGQEVTLTVRYPDGSPVPGGAGVPSRGGAIMVAPWR